MEFYGRKIPYGDIKKMSYREFHGLYAMAFNKRKMSNKPADVNNDDIEDVVEDMTHGI